MAAFTALGFWAAELLGARLRITTGSQSWPPFMFIVWRLASCERWRWLWRLGGDRRGGGAAVSGQRGAVCGVKVVIEREESWRLCYVLLLC